MATLLDIIRRVRTNRIDESDWPYIVGSVVDLALKTEADLGCPTFDEASHDEIAPVGFSQCGLRSTIDVDMLSSCIEWADQLSGAPDDNAALHIIRYYIRFDAWPETLNAPDPPPPDEILPKAFGVWPEVSDRRPSSICPTPPILRQPHRIYFTREGESPRWSAGCVRM